MLYMRLVVMTSSKLAVFFALSCLAPIAVFGQDPGYQDPAERRAAAPAAPAPQSPINKSAAFIHSMDVLDDTQIIESGDTISIRIEEDRRDPVQLRVGATGEVYAPHVGLIRATGRTCKQFAYELKRRLEQSYYNSATVLVAIDLKRQDDPNVQVRTADIDFFTVYGQVLRMGKYELPMDEDITISQAILRAGGFAQFANPKRVKLVRKTPQGNKTVIVNLDEIMRRGNLEYDLYIRANDVIIVDEKKVNF